MYKKFLPTFILSAVIMTAAADATWGAATCAEKCRGGYYRCRNLFGTYQHCDDEEKTCLSKCTPSS